MRVTCFQVISPAQKSVQVKGPNILFALQWTLNYGLSTQGHSFKETFDLSLSTLTTSIHLVKKLPHHAEQEHATFHQGLVLVQ